MRTANLISASLVILFFSFNSHAHAETAFPKGLSFEKPAGWFEASSVIRNANIKKFEFTKPQLDRLLANDQASRIIAVFHRDDPSRTRGIIPTIQVILRPKSPTLNFEKFKNSIADANALGKMLENFSIVGNVETPEISGVRSVLFNGRFSLTHQSITLVIRTRTYAIPADHHFLQVSMSGEDNEDWTDKEFTLFMKSLKILN